MSTALSYEADRTCAECGCFGAYVFASEALCMDCYQQRGACCAERDLSASDNAAPEAPPSGELVSAPTTPSPPAMDGETHRLNPNCCYKACPRCSSVRRLRDFQSRHPDDWHLRLRGLPRLVAAAQLRD